MNIEQQRKAFDDWVLKHPDYRALTNYEENIMFDAWLAAQQQEGYVIVPVEPIDEIDLMICKMVDHRIDCFEADRIYKAIIEESQK